MRVGELLLQQKTTLQHGEFRPWIAAHCEFEQSTATRYMLAARQNASGVAISNLRHLFPSGERKAANKPRTVERIPQDDHDLEPATTDAELTVAQAIEILEPIPSQRQLVSRFRAWRSKVGKLRIELQQAERELALAESAVIKAALDKVPA